VRGSKEHCSKREKKGKIGNRNMFSREAEERPDSTLGMGHPQGRKKKEDHGRGSERERAERICCI